MLNYVFSVKSALKSDYIDDCCGWSASSSSKLSSELFNCGFYFTIFEALF